MLSNIFCKNKSLKLNLANSKQIASKYSQSQRGIFSITNQKKLANRSIQSPKLICVRNYHGEQIFGHRIPSEVKRPYNTEEELLNRQKNARLVRLVDAFKEFGHRAANLDPLEIQKKDEIVDIEPERYGFKDPNEVFELLGILHINESETSTKPKETATFSEILNHLKKVYSSNIGFEYMHIPDNNTRKWFSSYVETEAYRTPVPSTQKDRFFKLLSKSEVFDHFMTKKYGQVKRYGLEGAESMMVALDQLFELCNKSGATDIIMCMPHRGRLNLLTSLLELPPRLLFRKLSGKSEFPSSVDVSGDVISHLTSEPVLDYNHGNKTKLTLIPNPSHLEAANPVALGKTRAKQIDLLNKIGDSECVLGDKVVSVQLHGDASFTGQGVVMESLGLSNLSHYSCGGTIHIIVNNQIGYTTPVDYSRSTIYTSDIGKMINAPIIHVNGDHPESVAKAIEVAFKYREVFRKDVILDLISFRRWGHNELDEPSFTQPLMYEVIRARKSVPKLYEEYLISSGLKTAEEVEASRKSWFDNLEAERLASSTYEPELDAFKGKWSKYSIPKGNEVEPVTGVARKELIEVGIQSVTTSNKITVHPRLEKFHVQPRIKKLESDKPLDWATAEALAFGSLLNQGHSIRISGQDVGRGTFSQRHAMFVCQKTEEVEVPLNSLPNKNAGKLEVANSSLSEFAVLGFEVGASWESPNSLVIWEAQFGDFNTTAQVIIDTYLVSGETKWARQSGLVMLLPHGYDGAGPEHSSCKIERFLQLSDDPFFIYSPDTVFNPNISVVNPTTPAQYFHLLRRQVLRDYRRPLIIAGPKTLLRLSAATSTLSEMDEGTQFKPVLDDPSVSDSPDSVKRVVFLSGKIYYELLAEKAKNEFGSQVALVRLEELCPFPKAGILEILEKYKYASEYIWCQEETMNAGAFTHIFPRMMQLLQPLQNTIKYIGRGQLAAPVTGISSVYKTEQANIIKSVFANIN
ncbi:putative 2-oxoglutarate dehydrogenase E1 component DHKTD1, mitochondrial [Smittium culicis]|uniref:Putative 2-oxoglutarate dehydrogenase E1 component DHKTD1, mitochondrial n=1 Tax=Smittium culicis TaxID=133412 RepID=A0A1R1XSU7_9FUNG|nr:putative 2-oxoglutarate dehydrogenase E1 component DHKTD1, mitochondrial [Smittium culicis]